MEFIAHRAGNDPELLRRAESVVDIVEVDVHPGAGTGLDVRHAKRLWLTRRLWERWFLLPADTAVPSLEQIIASADPSTTLWLDLKGYTRRISTRTLATVGTRRPLTVSTKSWWLLQHFAAIDGIRTIRSAGNRLELMLLTRLPFWSDADGVVVHHRLLSDAVIERLRRRGLVFTWAVDDVASIERLARLGVDGVILDDLTLVAPGRRAALTSADETNEPEADS
jgi:glycerophosphoryl diester phosphodiesterase